MGVRIKERVPITTTCLQVSGDDSEPDHVDADLIIVHRTNCTVRHRQGIKLLFDFYAMNVF